LTKQARNEAELRKELFNADPNDDDRGMNRKGKKKNKKQNNRNRGRQSDAFDEDGGQNRRYRDEEDDIGGGREGISEAQFNEANDIFGTEFLDFMGGGGKDGDEDYDGGDGEKFRERGVGVDLGVDSAEDDDDLDDDLDDSDVPERYFDWNTPFHGPSDD